MGDASLSSATTQDISVFESAAHSVVGAENTRAANDQDRVAGVQPQLVVSPADEKQLAQVMKAANDAGLAVVPRGGGTKLAWGNPPRRADVILSTARLNAVVEHAHSDLTVTVEAGCTLQHLAETLGKQNQRLALDTLWPDRATVGGILSTNDSGILRLRFGSLRDLVIGATLALADGTLAKSGGKVVKNVAGYDLPKLATGAFGTLGVITQATFRLHPTPIQSRTISATARDSRDAQRLVFAIQNSKLAHSALQIRFVDAQQPQLDVLFEATEAGCSAQVDQLKSLLEPTAIVDSAPAVRSARQDLYSEGRRSITNAAVARLSILPVQIAETHDLLSQIASATHARFNAVMQATGLGTILLTGDPVGIGKALHALRTELESKVGGSLTIEEAPAISSPVNCWGEPGDRMTIMQMVKRQFDPKSTLNPGRFVGGI
jgi:glycolate oxidase FAD binding subunit